MQNESDQAVALLCDAALACASACRACAEASVTESTRPALAQSIRLNVDCAELCETLAKLLSRPLDPNKDVARGAMELCAMACDRCAEETEQCAAGARYCPDSVAACQHCAEQCRITLHSFI